MDSRDPTSRHKVTTAGWPQADTQGYQVGRVDKDEKQKEWSTTTGLCALHRNLGTRGRKADPERVRASMRQVGHIYTDKQRK